jgi:hypothetical protein
MVRTLQPGARKSKDSLALGRLNRAPVRAQSAGRIG